MCEYGCTCATARVWRSEDSFWMVPVITKPVWLVFAISWHPETQRTGSRRDCPRSAWPVDVSVGEDPAHCDWHHSLALGLVSGLSKSREGLHSFLPAFAHSWDKVHGVPAGLTSLWYVSSALQMNTRLLHNSSFLGVKSWLRHVAWRLLSLTTYCRHCLPQSIHPLSVSSEIWNSTLVEELGARDTSIRKYIHTYMCTHT